MSLVTSQPLGTNRGSIWSNFLNSAMSGNYMSGGAKFGMTGSSITSMIGQLSQASEKRHAASMAYTKAEHSLDFNLMMADHDKFMVNFNERIEEKRLRERINQVVGTAIAAGGSSGFASSSESTQLAIDAIVKSGELDASIIRMKGDIGRWEAETSRLETEYQKKELRRQERYQKKQEQAKMIYSIVNTAMSSYGNSLTKSAG